MTRKAKDGLCVGCRQRLITQRYFWTPEQESMLREAYLLPRKRQRADALTRLQELTGYPRHQLSLHARKLGIARPAKLWTKPEIVFLQNHSGSIAMREIARLLGRSLPSIKGQLAALDMLGRVREGYDVSSLAEFMGVNWKTVSKWEDRGFLRRNNSGKFGEVTVVKFLRNHPAEYDLRRVDQVLFKSLIFPEADCYSTKIIGNPIQEASHAAIA